jgi:hypothetical protein
MPLLPPYTNGLIALLFLSCTEDVITYPLPLLIAVEKTKATLIFCSLKMTYLFSAPKLAQFFFPSYGFKFLLSYVMILLLLLVSPDTLVVLLLPSRGKGFLFCFFFSAR